MELIIGKKKRQLTKFLCREMIYDYVKGSLNEDRRQSVENFLSKDEDLREETERLRSAVEYCQGLGGARLSRDFYEEVNGQESQIHQWIKILSWNQLPDRAKWVLEAFAIAALVAGFSIYIPWESFFSSFPQDKPPIQVESQVPEVIASETTSGGIVEAKDPLHSESVINEVRSNENSEATQIAEPAPEPSVVSNVEISDEVGESVATPKKKPILVGKKEALKGVLFRAFIKLDNIDTYTAEFREKILSLGGEKAGEVEIGWRKPDGSYFHFSIEEENLEPLKQFMSGYGPVRFYKDPHWRVMPEGKIRMILWVEDSEYKK